MGLLDLFRRKRKRENHKVKEIAVKCCAIQICNTIANDLGKVPLDTATVGVVLLERCVTILDEIGHEDMELVDDAKTMINQPNIINSAKSLVKATYTSQVKLASERPEVVAKFNLSDVLQTGINLIDQA